MLTAAVPAGAYKLKTCVDSLPINIRKGKQSKRQPLEAESPVVEVADDRGYQVEAVSPIVETKMAKKTGKRVSFSEDEWVSQRLELAIAGFAYHALLDSACKVDLFSYLKRNPHAALKQIARDLDLPKIFDQQSCSWLAAR